MAIPKIIHQTYASVQVAPEIARNIERLKAMNPGWQHAFYDDAAIEAFIRRYYDLDMLARELTDEQAEAFYATAEGTRQFATDLHAARQQEPATPHLRAL